MSTEFTLNNLVSHSWKLTDEFGLVLAPKLSFHKDGSIIGSLHSNEFSWKWSKGCLNIFSEDGVNTSRFSKVYYLGKGKYLAKGSFLLDPDKKRYFLLESYDIHHDWFDDYTGISSSLGRNTNKLIIQINSAATPFDGYNFHGEFNKLVNLAHHDVVRVSEGNPPFWYLNKINKIVPILIANISLGYKQVFILGSSAGGYAALMFGEILANKFPDIEFQTFSINAKVTFEKSHLDYIKNNIDRYYMGMLLDDWQHKYFEINDTSISKYLAEKKKNIVHNIFYDLANPIEKYHCNLIKGFDRIKIHDYLLGISHGEGCEFIGTSDRFESFFLKKVNCECEFNLDKI